MRFFEFVIFGLMPVGFVVLFVAMEKPLRRARVRGALLAGVCIAAPCIHIVLFAATRGTVFEIPAAFGDSHVELSTLLEAGLFAVAVILGCWWEAQRPKKKDVTDSSRDSR